MVILQLLTAKPARALAHLVETAIAKGTLAEMLDSTARNWPFQDTLGLARLGLSCAELRRRDRPDLKDHDVMENHCVAADGYTYDYKAIVTWLQTHDKSPRQNMPLPHENLIPML
ncbi:hypothetical protein K1719_013788 [Acacia pycnantha]|nr:hypothetical protein K1719_013788 [Acacia pycnantha]